MSESPTRIVMTETIVSVFELDHETMQSYGLPTDPRGFQELDPNFIFGALDLESPIKYSVTEREIQIEPRTRSED